MRTTVICFIIGVILILGIVIFLEKTTPREKPLAKTEKKEVSVVKEGDTNSWLPWFVLFHAMNMSNQSSHTVAPSRPAYKAPITSPARPAYRAPTYRSPSMPRSYTPSYRSPSSFRGR